MTAADITANEAIQALDSLCNELAALRVENARLTLHNLALSSMHRHLHAAATADAGYIDNLLEVVCTLRSELIAARTQIAAMRRGPNGTTSTAPDFSFEGTRTATFQDRVSPERWMTS